MMSWTSRVWKAHVTDGGQLKLTVPIYHGVRKRFMLGMNWMLMAHHTQIHTVKKSYMENIGKVLPSDMEMLKSPITIQYKVFYKNPRSDAGNIIATADKFVLDALQNHGVIEEDNVQHYTSSSWQVIERDSDEPRVEISIKGSK